MESGHLSSLVNWSGASFGSGEQPAHEVDGAEGHAGAEHDARQEALAAAFPEREGDPADDDRDQAEAAGDRPSEAGRQDSNCVLPGGAALGVASRWQEEEGSNREWQGGLATGVRTRG